MSAYEAAEVTRAEQRLASPSLALIASARNLANTVEIGGGGCFQ